MIKVRFIFELHWSKVVSIPYLLAVSLRSPLGLSAILIVGNMWRSRNHYKNIMSLTESIKIDITKVQILVIIPRRDTFNKKAKQVNKTLKMICKEENIPFISHHGINTMSFTNSTGIVIGFHILNLPMKFSR